MPPGTSDFRAPVPFDGEELPPLGHAPHWARPIKTQNAGFWDGHWIGFLFLLPFVVMFVVHEILGMSNALLGGDTPRDDDARLYNLIMLVTPFLGSLAFVIYAFALPIVKGRGWRWVLPKLIFLVFYWGAVMLAVGFSSLRDP